MTSNFNRVFRGELYIAKVQIRGKTHNRLKKVQVLFRNSENKAHMQEEEDDLLENIYKLYDTF